LNCFLNKGQRYFLQITSTNGQTGSTVTAKWGYRKHFDEILYINDNDRRGELACYFEFDDQQEQKHIAGNSKYISGLISIIIPCYNSSVTIESTLESIKKQIYNHYEIIVVDDCSDDVNRLKKLLDNYECKFISIQSHRGAPAVRNLGASKASGEFLFFCDSDVVLEKDALFKMIQKLHENKSAAWVYGNFKWGDKNLTFYPFNKERMYSVNCSSTMSLLRHEYFPGFDESLKKLQDWDLFLTMMENGLIGIWENSFLFQTEFSKTGITNNSIPELEARKILKLKHPKIKKV